MYAWNKVALNVTKFLKRDFLYEIWLQNAYNIHAKTFYFYTFI